MVYDCCVVHICIPIVSENHMRVRLGQCFRICTKREVGVCVLALALAEACLAAESDRVHVSQKWRRAGLFVF